MRKGFVVAVVALLVIGLTGMAHAWSISDGYVGADDHGKGDVIGNPANFDVDSMDVQLTGDIMTVKVYTDFTAGTYFGKFIDYGDLFISTDGWNPYGDAPYLGDDASNGETWEYVFDVSAGALYDITGAQDQILLSNDALEPTGLTYRDGQEVLIDSTGLATVGTGTAGKVDGYYEMSFDVSALGLPTKAGYTVGLHWAMTCGNDVIEGEFDPVPEPSTVFLFGAGLLGLLALGRKQFK